MAEPVGDPLRPPPLQASRPAAASASPAPAAPAERVLELTVGPLSNPDDADNLVELFKEVVDLGRIEPLDAGRPADGMRRFKLVTSSSSAAPKPRCPPICHADCWPRATTW